MAMTFIELAYQIVLTLEAIGIIYIFIGLLNIVIFKKTKDGKKTLRKIFRKKIEGQNGLRSFPRDTTIMFLYYGMFVIALSILIPQLNNIVIGFLRLFKFYNISIFISVVSFDLIFVRKMFMDKKKWRKTDWILLTFGLVSLILGIAIYYIISYKGVS